MPKSDIVSDISPMRELGARACAASQGLAMASTAEKNEALRTAADCLAASALEILEANAVDVRRAKKSGTPDAIIDRLRLDPARVEAMALGLRQVIDLPDPVGEVVERWTRPNGLEIEKIRVPLGVVAIIYENRPNVTLSLIHI